MNPQHWSSPNAGHRGVHTSELGSGIAATTIRSKLYPSRATTSTQVPPDGSTLGRDVNTSQRREIIVKNPVIRVKQRADDRQGKHESQTASSPGKIHEADQAGLSASDEQHTDGDLDITNIIEGNTVVIKDEDDHKPFLRLATTFDLTYVHFLTIHLNASQHDEYIDDILAIALNQFHPVANGKNPHRLDKLTIVLHGNTLFTRHNYTLVSPAASSDVINNLSKLMTGGLNPGEKERLAYRINITEKAVVKALLGIRGVQTITVQGIGGAKMESRLQELIEKSLILPPNAPTPEDADSDSEDVLAREGVVGSIPGKITYKLRDYKQVKPSWKDRFYSPPSPPRSPPGRRRGGRSAIPGLVSSGCSSGTEVGHSGPSLEGRTMSEMVRIMPRQQDNDDLLTSRKAKINLDIDQQLPRGIATQHGEWLVLTGKGNDVQLGWRV